MLSDNVKLQLAKIPTDRHWKINTIGRIRTVEYDECPVAAIANGICGEVKYKSKELSPFIEYLKDTLTRKEISYMIAVADNVSFQSTEPFDVFFADRKELLELLGIYMPPNVYNRTPNASMA